ncbi:hypothetical protein ACEPAI_9417 [Sanghuangporus weigelae]
MVSLPATRSSTMLSTDSELKDSDLGGSDPPDLRPSLLDKSGLSRIFMDAVQYSEVISDQDGAISSTDSSREGDTSGEDGDKARAQSQPKRGRHEPITRTHLTDFIVHNLSKSDFAATERFAKFAAIKEGDVLDVVDLSPSTESPPVGVSGDEGESREPQSKPTEERPLISDAQVSTDSLSELSPEQIVQLLIDEFGPLTAGEDDTERLIWEMDGCYLQEVAILGTIHLTTHRITFHASLLSTRPDLLPEKQIIRGGPVTVHRKGLLRKRRLWLELSHDMLTVFRSSKEEDRIRPIGSCLLSSIKRLCPEDENNKKAVKMEFFTPGTKDYTYIEFDTEESAREWRRELQGAVFMYRRRRASFLQNNSEDDMRGVQISIPLSRVKSFATHMVLNYAFMIDIEISSGKVRSSLSDTDSDSDGTDKEQESSSSSDDEEPDIDQRTIVLGVARNTPVWDDMETHVKEAKEREQEAGIKTPPKVVVDFGPLSFVDGQSKETEVEDNTEHSIRNALGLGEDGEIWYTRARITMSVASYGYFVISKRYIAFWAKCLSVRDVKIRFPLSKVAGARPIYRYMPRKFGMVLILKEHRSMNFDFTSEDQRDDVIKRIKAAVEAYGAWKASYEPVSLPIPANRTSTFFDAGSSGQPNGRVLTESPMSLTTPSPSRSPTRSPRAGSSSTMNSTVPLATAAHVLSPLSRTVKRVSSRYFPPSDISSMPKVINLPNGTLPRVPSKHFVCLTIGSRGDVQPYIALGQTLMKEGHRVTIVTHDEYKDWIVGWGIAHRPVGGDPGALMKLSVEHKMFSPQFFKESIGNFRSWLDNLLVDAWENCKDADVLLESPSAMAGVHIAEALDIPYFRTFTMPWSKTTEFPHPFLSTPVDLPRFNVSTYVLFDNLFWYSSAGQVNRWRRNTLHIGNTDMDHLAQSKIPFIYNFSPSVVPKPLDWGDQIAISGYWFLDNPDLDWTPPASLLQWMSKAREDGKPIVYIGFGSITVPNPPAMTRSILKAVEKSGVRAIISRGWSSRMSKPSEIKFEFPPECYVIDKIPHDWLFPQIDAALHHGGAGTTGASLRAGIPTLIKPWFGDQFFWASRVQKIGAGMKVSLNASELAGALIRATSDSIMKERAASVGDNIRQENGTVNALHAIYTYLDRAGRVRKEKPN